MEFTGVWEDLTRKMGYWVNMDDPYITYDNKYIETLWWLLKQLYDKGCCSTRATPYNPIRRLPARAFDPRTEPAGLLPRCKRHDLHGAIPHCPQRRERKTLRQRRARSISWRGRPRRGPLPSNTALAVGPTIEYVKIKCRNPYTNEPQTVIMARDLVPSYFTKKMEGTYELTGESWKGSELAGIRYEQLIPWVKPMSEYGDAFRVITGDYVTTSDGTGIVHIAPTFGADDDRVAKSQASLRCSWSTRQAKPSRWSTDKADSSYWKTSTPHSWRNMSIRKNTANMRAATSRMPMTKN